MYGDYEAVFRWSLVRMAIEQLTGETRLTRTNAAKALDPTEKSMVSYFLGMTFCKLFSDKLLNTPWLLHLDVFRPELDPVLRGLSRPDLVGHDSKLNQWHGFECKGRVRPPDSTAKKKAKDQAQRLVSVKGVNCSLHVGALTYFRNDVLHFYWRDPPPHDRDEIALDLPADAWRYYYDPIAEVLRGLGAEELTGVREGTDAADFHQWRDSSGNLRIPIGQCDLNIGVHRAIERHLFDQEWEGARHAASEAVNEIREEGFQADGLRVRAGESWHEKFQEPSELEGDHGEGHDT